MDLNALADVSASDLAIVSSAAQISEDAETGTGGFNDAIAAAGGTGTTAGTALQNGKIKVRIHRKIIFAIPKLCLGSTICRFFANATLNLTLQNHN